MNVELKEWSIEMAPALAAYMDNRKITDNLRDGIPSPYTVKDGEEFIAAASGSERALYRAVFYDGTLAGSISISLQDNIYQKSAEIGYFIAEPFWGLGIATCAIQKMCALAFSRFDLTRIFAEPFAYNEGSKRALCKAGFTLEGVMRQNVFKNGRVHDGCMFSILRDELPPTE